MIGAAMGLVVGWLGAKLLTIARPPASAMFPVLTVGVALFSFGVATFAGGSGFVATYLTAVVLGNVSLPYRGGIHRVHDSLTGLAQLLMFLILGLLITPSAAVGMAVPGLVVAIVSMTVRVLVALVCLAPLRMNAREIAYIGAVGLRGAVPIVLGIFPVMAGVANAEQIFDLAFFVVLVNTIFPGTISGILARNLGLGLDRPPAPPATLEILSSGIITGGEFIAFTIQRTSAALGARVSEIPMPPDSSILLLIRRGKIIAPDVDAILGEGDHVYVFSRSADCAFVRLIFGLLEPE